MCKLDPAVLLGDSPGDGLNHLQPTAKTRTSSDDPFETGLRVRLLVNSVYIKCDLRICIKPQVLVLQRIGKTIQPHCLAPLFAVYLCERSVFSASAARFL